ncbi:Phosphoglycerate mutase family protein, partial [Thalictrum thalictroides]
ELNFVEEQIQSSDELLEMSQGQWEGCLTSEIYTNDMVSLIDRLQPDFAPPSGESLRQVEFRMIQFFNGTVLSLPEKLRIGSLSPFQQNESKEFSPHNSQVLPNLVNDRFGPIPVNAHGELPSKNRQGLSRKKSGKSRLQFVTTTGDHEVEDETSSHEANNLGHLHDLNVQRSSSVCSSSIGIFTHAVPIRCLVAGLLGCSPAISHKICIDDSSVTVLQYSLRTGWLVKRLNDTAHLRLL